MDQYLSTVIIAVITGVFSVITLLIQKKQDKIITKIDEQTTFIEREKILKQKLTQKEKEREALIYQIQILILDTNLYILKNTNTGGVNVPSDEVLKMSEDIKAKFNALNAEITDIRKEYQMVLDLTNEFQKEIEKSKK